MKILEVRARDKNGVIVTKYYNLNSILSLYVPPPTIESDGCFIVFEIAQIRYHGENSLLGYPVGFAISFKTRGEALQNLDKVTTFMRGDDTLLFIEANS